MNIIFKYWSVFIIVERALFFASPYFLQNKVPYPATFQNSFFSPWSSYEQYAVPVKNNALSDVVTQAYPWKHFTIEELKKGQIPWWNPYSFTGSPHVADFQTAIFSPFNLLFFILPFIDAWSLLILLQSLLAGIFTFIFLRQLKISNEGSLIGSIAFMFCGFMVVWMPYGTLSMAIAFLPLALFAVERCFGKESLSRFLLISLCLALSIFSGHIQTSFYFILFTLAYIFFKYYITKNEKTTLKVLAFFCLGIIISLIQIIPSWQVYSQSVRSGLFSTEGAIPFSYLITIMAPDFFGNPVTRNDWVGNYAEWAGFIGIIPFLLSGIAIVQRKGNKLFFLLTGIIALFFAISSPLQGLLINLKLPIFSTSIPSRIIVLFSFSFSVLAAYDLDTLREFIEKKKMKKIMLVCAALACFVLCIWLFLFIFKPLPQDKTVIAVRNLLLPTLFLFLASALIFLIPKIKNGKYGRLVLYILIIITITDSLLFAQKWMPFDAKELVFPNVQVIKVMQQKVGQGRVYGKFGSYIDTYYRLPSIEGYDPLYIRRYGEFLESAKTGTYAPAVKSLVVLDKRAKHAQRVLDVLGVTVLFHVIGDTGKDWAYPVWKKDANGKYAYSVIYQDDKFQLYNNPTALPRAKLFYDYEIIKNDKEIIKRFYSKDFDYRNKLILEEDPELKINNTNLFYTLSFPRTRESRSKIDSWFAARNDELLNSTKNNIKEGKATIISYSPNKVIIDADSPQPGLLFLSDNYYPNWKAKVNAKDTTIFRADYTLRAVVVPQGKSKVEFYYNPWSPI